jgi:hypothetical protein
MTPAVAPAVLLLLLAVLHSAYKKALHSCDSAERHASAQVSVGPVPLLLLLGYLVRTWHRLSAMSMNSLPP